MSEDDEDVRAQPLRHVEQFGRKYHSTRLVALAYRASADPFAKVRGMIEVMIAKLCKKRARKRHRKRFVTRRLANQRSRRLI